MAHDLGRQSKMGKVANFAVKSYELHYFRAGNQHYMSQFLLSSISNILVFINEIL